MKDWAATQLAALDAAAGQGPLIPAPWATRHEPPSGQAEGFLQEAGLKSYHKTGLAYKEKVGGEPIALEIKIGAEFQHNSATTKVYSQETVSVNFGPFSMYDTVGVQGEVPAHFQDHFVDALQMQLTLMIYDDHDVVYNPAQ